MKTTIALLFWFLPFTQFVASPAFADDAKPTYTLLSRRQPGQTDRVAVLIEVGGELKERGKDQRTPMSGVDNLVYHETTVKADPDRLRSVRYYEKAQSNVKFRERAHAPSLAEQRRLVGVSIDPPDVNLFALRAPLTRDELDLVIDVLGNSLLLDRLLPEGAVAVGQSWKPAEKTAAALLRLDGTTRCELQCTLKEVTDTVARVDLSGSIAGPVNDTTAKIELKGKYRFDLRTGRIDWLALVTKEERGISQVAAGFNVTVRFQMTITPEETPPQLAREKLAELGVEPTPELSQLRYESPQDRWQITYDRRWYLNSDDREHAMLRLIRQGTLTGQCNISSLQQRERDQLVSLEDYQDDVRSALGKDFGELVEAKQWGDSAGRRVLRVVANGTAHGKSTEVPIQWIYYHVADQDGRQVALTFTVEQEHLERFAEADRAIVDSLRFAASGSRAPLAKPDAKAQTKDSRSLVK
jgi:hypothetical protein